jgi:hypothetical protein
MVNLAGQAMELQPMKQLRSSSLAEESRAGVTLLDASYGSGQLLMRPLVPVKQRLRQLSSQSVQDYRQYAENNGSPGSRLLRINVAPSRASGRISDENLPDIHGDGFKERDLRVVGRRGSPAAAALYEKNKHSVHGEDHGFEESLPITERFKKLRPGYKNVNKSPKHLPPVKVRKYNYPKDPEAKDEDDECTARQKDELKERPDFNSTIYSPMFPPFWRQLLQASEEEAIPLVSDVIRSHEDVLRWRKSGDDKKPRVVFGIGF